MARKIGLLVLLTVLGLPSGASELGKISGIVKDSAGVPQMGAKVEVYGPSSLLKTLFTDTTGRYSVAGLASGIYEIKVSAPSFLPSLREHIQVRTGTSMLVNITLNTIFEALQLGPERRQSPEQDEDWKWTLRSMSNRPVLRVLEDDPLVVVSKSDGPGDKALKARVAFMAGADSNGNGSTPAVTTAFSVERSMFGAGNLSFQGDFAHTGDGIVPAAVMRAAYSHRMADGSNPQISLMMRRLSSPELSAHNVVLQALALSASNDFSLGDAVRLNLGTELQSIGVAGTTAAVYPFGTATVHLSPNTVLSYGYSTFEPNMRAAKGYDSAPPDLSESGPRVSVVGWKPKMERASHHELAVSRRIGRNNVQLAVYSDRIKNSALTGAGPVDMDSGAYLPDFSAGTFTYGGADLHTRGIRAVYERKLTSDLVGTLDYAYGGVLDVAPWTQFEDVADVMVAQKRHALSYRMSGTVPWCKGKWIASYRWTSGPALTPVDLFNSGPGQTDPYLSFFIKQPIPGTGFIPGHVEALVDVRNLLAQGYLPVVGQDGRTLYLVQSARAVRGGVSFTF